MPMLRFLGAIALSVVLSLLAIPFLLWFLSHPGFTMATGTAFGLWAVFYVVLICNSEKY